MEIFCIFTLQPLSMEKNEVWVNKSLELLRNWPLLLFILILCFKKDIQHLMANSQSITIGQLSIKVKEEILQQPSDEIRKILPKLTADDIQLLLQDFNKQAGFVTNGPTTIGIIKGPSGSNFLEQTYKHLFDLGLYIEIPPSKDQQANLVDLRITPLGESTRNFLNEVFLSVIKRV